MKVVLKKIIKRNTKLYDFLLKIGCLLKYKKIKREEIDYNKILEEYSPKPKEKTYYSKNKIISQEYDLQIIIPAYNVEKYIEECIESVLNQKTKYKILIVIINDGSTDKTLSIIKKYEKYQNIKIINQKNTGISEARNRGIEKIYAKYLMFLDSDDILLENAIENLMSVALKFKAEIVEGSYYQYFQKKLYNGFEHKNRRNEKLYGFPWGKVLINKIFEELRFPLKTQYEDSIFSYLIYPKYLKFQVIENYVYGYRNNFDSITNKLKNNRRNIETYYITEELIKNGLNLYNIKISKEIYIHILNQIKVNHNRTIKCPDEIKKAIFFRSQDLLNSYFKNFLGTSNGNYKILEDSILNNNYAKYEFICKYGNL